MRTLRVADLEAKPGEKVSGFVHIIGAEFGIPVTLICGEKEGETVLISGGVHNAEYVGIQAAMQLADELDPKKDRRKYHSDPSDEPNWIRTPYHESYL